MSEKLIMSHEEANREGLDPIKLKHFFDVVVLGKTARADAYLNDFGQFDIEHLRDLTGKFLAHVLLDVDGCIAPPYGPIRDENLGHIDDLKRRGVSFGVYSNCKGMERLQPLRQMDVPIYSGKHAKPAAKGFIEACESMNFDPNKTWMIGDNPLTDGGAVGVLEGTVFVKPIATDYRLIGSKLKRASMFFSGIFRKLALARTLDGNKKIHRFLN